MNLLQAVVLGVIQGLTEFLPISSSGHLVLFQRIFGLTEAELFFDTSVHLGTLVAVVIVFWNDVKAITGAVLRLLFTVLKKNASVKPLLYAPEIKMAFLIVIGSVPTAIIGLFFRKVADQLFSSVTLVGAMLLITGLVLWATRRIAPANEGFNISRFSGTRAFIVGTVQGLAILPGISRSGATISAGLFLGLNRETAAKYSFLLSVPAILGAVVLSLKDISTGTDMNMTAALTGSMAACVVGYGALKYLIRIVKRGRLHFFAPYCWFVGILALILGP